jgi:hypothetical protein
MIETSHLSGTSSLDTPAQPSAHPDCHSTLDDNARTPDKTVRFDLSTTMMPIMEGTWSDERGSSLTKKFGKVALVSEESSPDKVLAHYLQHQPS